MNADDVIALLKGAKVKEALEAADEVAGKRELAGKLTEFAGQLNYLKWQPVVTEILLKKSLLLHYEHAPTHYNLGVLYSSPPKLEEDEETNLRKAEKAYENALRFDPEYHQARYNLALLHYLTKNIEAAKSEYAQILEAVGDQPQYRDLGMLLLGR